MHFEYKNGLSSNVDNKTPLIIELKPSAEEEAFRNGKLKIIKQKNVRQKILISQRCLNKMEKTWLWKNGQNCESMVS